MSAEKWTTKAWTFLSGRKLAYTSTFGTPWGQEVLSDLAKFCHATETAFRADPRKHALLEGRREVWLRIANHLNLSVDQLYDLASGKNINLVLKGDNQ